MLKDKYLLTNEESKFLAKKLMVDSIWKSANLEGIAVTFPDTQIIFDGKTVSGYKVEELISINNLKRSWYFIVDNIDYNIDFNYICKINQIVGGDDLIHRAGMLRDFDVAIGGTSWRPTKPVREEIEKEINEINKVSGVTDRAISMMLYLMRKQIFYDGNKRTAQIAANQIMLNGKAGLVSIPINMQSKFTKLLIDYYESNENETIKQFVYDNCIMGVEKYAKSEKGGLEL